MSTAVHVLSALLESARQHSTFSLTTTTVLALCTLASALLLAYECGQYSLRPT